jgi:hypothetical protein
MTFNSDQNNLDENFESEKTPSSRLGLLWRKIKNQRISTFSGTLLLLLFGGSATFAIYETANDFEIDFQLVTPQRKDPRKFQELKSNLKQKKRSRNSNSSTRPFPLIWRR